MVIAFGRRGSELVTPPDDRRGQEAVAVVLDSDALLVDQSEERVAFLVNGHWLSCRELVLAAEGLREVGVDGLLHQLADAGVDLIES